MAHFGRGAKGNEAPPKMSKFVPNIRWTKNETKYIQFMQSADDFMTAFVHTFVVVGTRQNGKPQYRTFISPQTDVNDNGIVYRNTNEYDPLWDDRNLAAVKRGFTVAVELEPVWGKNDKGKKVIDHFEVKQREWTDKEGDTHEVPAIGLVEGSPVAFFDKLHLFADSKGPIEEVVFQVKRTDGQGATSYTFLDLVPALDDNELDISDDLIIDLETYLEGLVMTDEDIAMIQSLPEGHVFNEYAERDKKAAASKDDENSSRSSKTPAKTRRVKAKEPETEDDDDGETEVVDDKSNRFAQLRRNMAK